MSNSQDRNDEEFLLHIAEFERLVGNAEIDNIIIADGMGNILFSLDRRMPISDVSEQPYYQRAMNAENFAEFGPFFSSSVASKNGSIYGVAPIGHDLDDGPIGAVIVTSRTDSIDGILLDRSGLDSTGEVYLVNHDGVMISESRFMQHVQYIQIVDTTGARNCIDNDMQTLGIYSDYRGIPILGATFCATNFVLLAEIDEQEMLQPIIQLQNELIMVGSITILVMGIVAFFSSRSISKPIILLMDAAKDITNGKLDITTGIKSNDEIGHLSLAFDTMTKRLKEQMRIVKQKEDVIRYEEDILLRFSDKTEIDCVCFIDVIDSTKTTQKLSEEMAAKLYETFLNEIAEIIKKYEGSIIKNIGDALLFSFVIQNRSKLSISNALDCCLAICEAHGTISDKLESLGLPQISYRISISFGLVRIATSSTSTVRDIFGSTVNRSSKINHMAKSNGMVCDEALYRAAKSMQKYRFEKISEDMISQYGYGMYRCMLESHQ